MTFAQSEESAYGGTPIELYTFTRDPKVWRYSTGEDPIVVSGGEFIPYPIGRDAIEQSGDLVRNALNVTCSADLPVLESFREGVPSGITLMTIMAYHYGVAEYITRWSGRIVNVEFSEYEAKLNCEPIMTTMLRPVLRRFYQMGCPHVLYGPDCRADRSAFRVDAELTGQSGSQLTSNAFDTYPDTWFAGGYVDWLEGTEAQRRFILSHTGPNILVNIPFINMPNNANVQVYPGCDHTFATCRDKFANNLNYGGQPYYPVKNPFGGSQIF